MFRGILFIISVGEERANFSAIVYLLLFGFCLEGFLHLGALNRMRCIMVALLGPAIVLKALSFKDRGRRFRVIRLSAALSFVFHAP